MDVGCSATGYDVPGVDGPHTPGSVVLATHYWVVGPATALSEYLQERTSAFQYIAHPLFGGPDPATNQIYEGGRLISTARSQARAGVLGYIQDVLRTIVWTQRRRSDLFIAGDNLLALAGLWLRWRGRTHSVVLYSIDYVPNRFGNPLLNAAYHAIDRFVLRHVDVTWNASRPIMEARRARDHHRPVSPQLVVPVGAWVSRVPRRSLAEIDPFRIVYLGHLLEKQGLQKVIEALPAVRRALPETSLLVIGDGPYLADLQRLAGELGVVEAIDFAGASVDHLEIERRLTGCALGVAPYAATPDNYSQFTDLPGKVVNYLAAGLAVVMTDVPARATLIAERGAGKVVAYDADALASALVELLGDGEELARTRQAAAELAREFDWTDIFDRALDETEAALAGREPQLRH